MRSFHTLLAVLILVTVALPAMGVAVEITTADGDGADSYVRGGKHAEANFGDDALLYCSYNRGGNAFSRKVYLRFDLSTLPADWQAKEVTLKVQVIKAGDSPLRVFGLKDDSPGQNWIETGNKNGITFNNAPANYSAGPWFNDQATGKLAESDKAGQPGVITFSGKELTEFINSDTDGIVTLMIVQAHPYNFMNIASKEHKDAKAPTLDIDLN